MLVSVHGARKGGIGLLLALVLVLLLLLPVLFSEAGLVLVTDNACDFERLHG